MSKPLRERLKEAAFAAEYAKRAQGMTAQFKLGNTLLESIDRIAADGSMAIAQRSKTTCLGLSCPKSRHSTSSVSQNAWTNWLSAKVWAMSLRNNNQGQNAQRSSFGHA